MINILELNKCYLGNNLDILKQIDDNTLDLVYIDTPFSTGRDFYTKDKEFAFTDKYTLDELIEHLKPRLIEIHRVLKDTGLFFFHGDWHFISNVKIELDKIFDINNFRNEIIWFYGGRGAKAISNALPRNHDNILVYAKSDKTIINKVYSRKYLKKNEYSIDEQGNYFYTSPRGDYTDDSIEELKKQNRVHETKTGTYRIKYFLHKDDKGVYKENLIGDVWDDIPDMMHTSKSERLGYPTQKPKALLERILKMGLPIVDGKYKGIVADFYAGSGTTLETAKDLGVEFIGCDNSEVAIRYVNERLNIRE